MKDTNKIKAFLGFAFTICAFVLLLIPTERISNSICNAIIFCGRIVIPRLFISVCLSRIVWELGIIERIIAAYPKFGAEISAFTMGILAGFPMGSIICSVLVDGGYITKKRGEYIITFSNNAGISFVFGYVSTIIGREGAVSVFVCQIVVSVFLAIVFRKTLSVEDKKEIQFKARKISFSSIPTAISKGVENVINICGFILFFSAFTEGLLTDMPLFLKGMAELTTGLKETLSVPFENRLVFCGAFVGFCGTCVHFQIASVSNVSIRNYIFSKCLSSVLFAILILPVHRIVVLF